MAKAKDVNVGDRIKLPDWKGYYSVVSVDPVDPAPRKVSITITTGRSNIPYTLHDDQDVLLAADDQSNQIAVLEEDLRKERALRYHAEARARSAENKLDQFALVTDSDTWGRLEETVRELQRLKDGVRNNYNRHNPF